MLTPSFHGSFNRDRKLMVKRGKNMAKIKEVMDKLLNKQPLLPKHNNHPLQGNFKGWWECHVEPDWLLIYRVDEKNQKVVFYRTGSHSDLF